MVGEEVGNGVVAVFVSILDCFVVASSGIDTGIREEDEDGDDVVVAVAACVS